MIPYVSLIVEALRARPVAVFWLAALAQAALWLIVPAAIYTSPPDDLAEALVIGRAHEPGSWRGPPLAFWLADAALFASGGRPMGIYVLAQLCVVAALWAIFTLARSLVGAQHAAMAVLLMGGVLVLAEPTPGFGPSILAMPLTALALLFFWRAVGEKRRGAWLAFGTVLGLLLLTSYFGLVVLAVLAAFAAITREGRAALRQVDPWAAVALAFAMAFPHVVWLARDGGWMLLAADEAGAVEHGGRWLRGLLLLAGIVASHVGLATLVLFASRPEPDGDPHPPEIEREPVPALGRWFVLFAAVSLPLAGALAAGLAGAALRSSLAAPMVLLSGLAVILVAGERVAVHRQRIVGVVWVVVLLAPATAVMAAAAAMPWIGLGEPSFRQPAPAMARFFGETFQRRVGAAPTIIVGESPVAYQIAALLDGRPAVFNPAAPQRTLRIGIAEVRARGAVAVWPLLDPTGAPPPAIRAAFPDLTAEVPQSFSRPIEGMQPALRVGWGLIHPQAGGQR